MTPLRITHVALQLETGGMERLLVEFARHADRDRFALRFLTLGGWGPVADEIEACGWPVDSLGVSPGARPSAVFKLSRLFQDQRPDIVHTHNTRPLLYAGAAARLAGVRGVVHTRHGQRHGSTFKQNALFRAASWCADRVVCVSDDAAALCRAEGVRAGAVRRIWNGVDVSRFAYTGPRTGGPAVFVGRLTPEKDVGTLLRAAAVVAAQSPGFRLLIAGDGPGGPGLRAGATELGLGGVVEFLGEVRDIAALLTRCSVFVLPSLTEGLPLTVLEAMARGLPVVATHAGGTAEAVEHGKTGVLVEPGDSAALAEALLSVYGSDQRARAMGLAGRARVSAWFDSRVMVGRYESLYADVIAGKERLAA